MGLIGQALTLLFGGGRNAIADTAEVFRVNAEEGDKRKLALQTAALSQMAAEFQNNERGLFDRVVDALNRLPRPAMALGTIALFVSAMFNPIWFAERMQGISLVPEPLWWLLGVVVSFYFGARHQAKGQEFQRSLAETIVRTPHVLSNLDTLQTFKDDASLSRASFEENTEEFSVLEEEDNPALEDWRIHRAQRD